MGRFKDFFRGGQKSFTRYATVVTCLFVLFVLVKPGSNIFNWISARREAARQERQIESYRRQLEQLDTRIDLLVTDRDTLEKFAREQFHLAAPGEDVYILEK